MKKKVLLLTLTMAFLVSCSSKQVQSHTPSRAELIADRERILHEIRRGEANIRKSEIAEELIKGHDLGASFRPVEISPGNWKHEFTQLDPKSNWTAGGVRVGDRLLKSDAHEVDLFDVVEFIYLSRYGGPITVMRESKTIELNLPSKNPVK